MDNQLFKKFDYYWFFVILTFILCYGFFITNHSMGIDDEIVEYFGSVESGIHLGRLGILFFSQILNLYEYVPFLHELVGLLLYVIGVSFHVQNFMKILSFEKFVFDKKMATIFSCLAISFPYLAFHFIFMDNIFLHGFILMLTANAVYYFYEFFKEKREKKYLIYVFLSLVVASSLYESACFYFIIGCLLIEFFKLIFDENRNFYKKALCVGFLAFFGMFFNVIIVKIIKKMMNVDYSKFQDFLKYDTTSFNTFLYSFIQSQKAFFNKFLETCEYNFGSLISIIMIILFILLSFGFTLKRKNPNILVCSFLLVIVPFTSFLLLGNYDLPYRNYSVLSFLLGGIFVLLFALLKEKKVLNKIIIVVVSLIVFYNAQELNQIFYMENLKYQDDKSFMHSIMYDIKKLGVEDKPIVWVGVRENPKLKYDYIESQEINTSVFNWDRYDSFKSEINVFHVL